MNLRAFTLAFATLSCTAAADRPRQPPPTEVATPAKPAVLPRCECGTEPGCPPCPAIAPSASAAAQPAPGDGPGTFPPAAFAPPVARTQKPGDGTWTALPVHRAPGADSPFQRTTVHPHPIRGFVVVEIVAIDTTRVAMDLILGPEEPEGSTAALDKRTGLVPTAALADLIAITNGGFKKRHGGHGVGVSGVTLISAQRDACTFAKLADNSYRVGPYAALEASLKDFRFFRQTPPCLIENGQKNPDLSNEYKAKKWGSAEDGNREIRRSAIALGKDQKTLFFAIGDYVTAEWLADGLVAAGMTVAAELDINYSYTRFITYDHAPGGELVAASPLLRELKAPKKEYWKVASPRDFFSLTWLPSAK